MKPSVILTSSLRVLTAATAVGLAVDLASAQLVTSRRALEGRNQDDFRQNSIIPRQGGGGGNGGGNNNGNGNNDQETVVVEATRVVTVRPGGNRPSATSSNAASPAKPSTTNNKDGEKSSSSQSGAVTSSPQTTGPTPSPSESDSSPSSSESTPAVKSSSPEPSEDDKDDDDRKEGGISAGTAAGIAAGAVAGLALIGLVAFVLWRRRRGPIRGAVVTADYPFGDGVGMMAAEKNLDGHPGDGNSDGQVPRLPDIRGLEASTRGPEYEYGFGTAAGMGAGGMDRAREGEDALPAFPADTEEVEYMDVPVGIGKEIGGIGAGAGYEYSPQQLQQQQFAPAAGVAGRYGFTSPQQQQDIPQMPQQQMAAIIPPAGMMPGAYFSPPLAQQQQQQQQVVPQPGGFQAYSSPPPHHPGGQAAYTSPPQQQPEGQAGYASPPQRKLTAEGMPVGMAMSTGEYHSYKPPQQAQQPPPQPVSPLEERRRGSGARTASAYMQGYPSPGNPPILPVSPLSTYYPDRQSSGPVQPPIISPYYPGANGPAEPNSPGDLPQYMIPGGSRSRAMSYSSQYAPTALDMNDGTPAPPVPSMPVMDSDGEPPLSPLRRNPIYEHF